ncbi:MAG: membrane protein insertion efficiency factor YidD [Pseudomonadales bacterium]|nr:membrane protein insertion efficiency factor YidD [Pseudomonadales bacterium]
MIVKFLKFLIRIYQVAFSALLGPRCRFYPSCSEYALQALTLHGPGRGMWLACKRILKCHPFHPGGIDLVPDHETTVSHPPACRHCMKSSHASGEIH